MKFKKEEKYEKSRQFTSNVTDNVSEFSDPKFNPFVVGEWGPPLDEAQIPRLRITEVFSIRNQRSCRSKN